jgi:erythronate-4-phosphate dehydrogenase
MIRVVADHKIPFLKGALEPVAKVDYFPGGEISRKDLLDADALITRTRTRCDRALLEGTGVKFIASATIGHDHIDAEYCREAGISWTNAPGCNASSVRQYMVSALLYLAMEMDLDPGKLTLGVVGAGNVGSRVAKAAADLGMKVLVNDPPRARAEGPEAFVSLEDLLEGSDIVSLHVPLNREGRDRTHHMVDAHFLEALKPGAILVNTSRGEVVREKDLLRALEGDRLAAVVLDVFENEPNPNIQLLDRLTLATPHIAGYSLDGKANGTRMSVQALSRAFGLGLDDWVPRGMPEPAQPQLLGDAAEEKPLALLWELYRQTYDVGTDDRRLRENPEAFEALRGEYPFRREPSAYSVRLFQGDPLIRGKLEALGFSVFLDICM